MVVLSPGRWGLGTRLHVLWLLGCLGHTAPYSSPPPQARCPAHCLGPPSGSSCRGHRSNWGRGGEGSRGSGREERAKAAGILRKE